MEEKRQMKSVEHIFELIGNTPLVKILNINPNPNIEIYAKLEWFNPTGSLKDRIALPMIERAESEGKLTKDKIILEATSGNTGISIAWVSALKGYRCVIVMPNSASDERKRILKVLGADLILTSNEAEAIKKARSMAEDSRYFLTDQFANEENWMTHYKTTGKEIWQQTQGRVTHFIAGIGTSGTLMGVGKRLKEYNPKIQIIGVQPSQAKNKQQGLICLEEHTPEIFDLHVADEILAIRDEDALATMKDLLRKEGLLVGVSSGSVMKAAILKAKTIREGLIVTIFADHCFKYCSSIDQS